jgi:hypothetical protein
LLAHFDNNEDLEISDFSTIGQTKFIDKQSKNHQNRIWLLSEQKDTSFADLSIPYFFRWKNYYSMKRTRFAKTPKKMIICNMELASLIYQFHISIDEKIIII